MSFVIGRLITYATVGALTVILNSLEIYLIVKRWRKTKPYEQLLLNLAVADFLVGGIRLITAIHEIGNPDWIQKSHSTFVWSFIQFSVPSSAINIFAISTDRLIAVKLPLRHRVWMSKRNVRIKNISTWILTFLFTSACTSLAIFVGRLVFYATGVIMMSITTALVIMHVLLIKSILMQTNFTPDKEQTGFRNGRRWERKVIFTCTSFLVIFIISTWPTCIEIVRCRKCDFAPLILQEQFSFI